MKNFFVVSIALCIFSGAAMPAFAQKHKKNRYQNEAKDPSPKFIEDIEITPGSAGSGNAEVAAVARPVKSDISSNPAIIEKTSSLQFKYAQLLNCNVELIKNLSLYSFIDEWWQTRYRYGGTSKSGIDCSAFTGLLMSTVFGIQLSRTARDQYNESARLPKDEMIEGDLVFFNTRGGISHVGLYLGERYFVHASTTSGVTISSLDDPYYSGRFVGGGRVGHATADLVNQRAAK